MYDVETKPGSKRVWGDGLVDHPLSAFYGHLTWDDVSGDELIILMPALARQKNVAGKPRDAAFFVRRMLTARVFDCVTRMAGETAELEPAPGLRQAAIDIVVRSQTVTAVSAIDAALSSDDIWIEIFGRRPASRYRSQSLAVSPAPPATSSDQWALELSILAALDRLLRDAERPQQGSAAAPIQSSDALLASIYAGFNAAYVYPELEFMHETLMLGAWLGFLERGRSALMPDFIAERILGYLKKGSDTAVATDNGRCEALIRTHLDYAGPRASLLRLAEQVRKSGRPCLVRPAAHSASPALRQAVTGEALRQRLEANGMLEASPRPEA
jgi:hypothetical protein